MRVLLGWVLSWWMVVASAAVPGSVSSGLSDALADAITVAGLALVVAVAIMAFRYMRRSLDSVGGGAGPGGYSSLGAMYDDLDPNR